MKQTGKVITWAAILLGGWWVYRNLLAKDKPAPAPADEGEPQGLPTGGAAPPYGAPPSGMPNGTPPDTTEPPTNGTPPPDTISDGVKPIPTGRRPFGSTPKSQPIDRSAPPETMTLQPQTGGGTPSTPPTTTTLSGFNGVVAKSVRNPLTSEQAFNEMENQMLCACGCGH